MLSKKNKYFILKYFYLAFFIILILRLIDLQIVNFKENDLRATKNRIRQEIILAPRGVIYDRNGVLLVDSVPSFSVSFLPYLAKKNIDNIDFSKLSLLINVPTDTIVETIKNKFGYRPIKIASDVSFETISYLSEHQEDFPGVFIQVTPKRNYIYKELAAHLLGYVKESKKKATDTYEKFVGKIGIEEAYDDILSGEDGIRFLEINAKGKILGEVEDFPMLYPKPGNNLVLTIDSRLQKVAEDAFIGGKRGAVVALDANSGAVLVMASLPNYDNNILLGKIPTDIWNELNHPINRPLINRAIKGVYPPGSILKPLIGIVSLNANIITANSVFAGCTGKYKLGNRYFGCWNKSGHGVTNLEKAIEVSCDVYFYQLATKINIDFIHEGLSLFGLGQPTGIDLYNEKKGLIPSREWYDRKLGKRGWGIGNLLNLCIGQGEIGVTPLQMATAYIPLAKDGDFYTPFIVNKITDYDGNILKERMIYKRRINLGYNNFSIVKNGLYNVVNGSSGTARIIATNRYKIAGKTGTAQNSTNIDHAWFVGFAPYENPKIVVAVLVEQGLHGSSAAGPIARKIFDAYLFPNEQIINLNKSSSDSTKKIINNESQANENINTNNEGGE